MPTTHYLWDSLSDCYLMQKGLDEATIGFTTEPSKFGPLISHCSSALSFYYHFDGGQSTRQLSDATQSIADSYSYTAFGDIRSGIRANVTPFKFHGAVGAYDFIDTNSGGETYVRRRIYSAHLTRWCSKDPLLESANPYWFAKNRPTMLIDPSGLLSQEVVESFPVVDNCGRFQLRTRWVLNKAEREGNAFIIQRVCREQRIEDCLNATCNFASFGFPCQNTTPFTGNNVHNRRKGCYVELWRVKDGNIYLGNPFGDNPTNEGDEDVFGFAGCVDPLGQGRSRGIVKQTGQAIFAPFDKLDKLMPLIEKLFLTPPAGIDAACDLASGQGDEMDDLWHTLFNLFRKTLLWKQVEIVWNCCLLPCGGERGTVSTDVSVSGSEILPREGEIP